MNFLISTLQADASRQKSEKVGFSSNRFFLFCKLQNVHSNATLWVFASFCDVHYVFFIIINIPLINRKWKIWTSVTFSKNRQKLSRICVNDYSRYTFPPPTLKITFLPVGRMSHVGKRGFIDEAAIIRIKWKTRWNPLKFARIIYSIKC